MYASYNMADFGPLVAEIRWRVWGTPANFNGFRVLASLLQRGHSTEVNQTCTMFGHLLRWYTIHTFSGGSCPLTEFCTVQNSLCIRVLRSPILAALLHGTPVVGVSQTAALSRGRHLYLAGQPSRWASAHILVDNILEFRALTSPIVYH